MIYCRLKSKTEKSASYSIGARTDDITGEIMIMNNGQEYEIIKEPEKEVVYPHFINKMIVKYTKQFAEGKYPEKMSYEI